MLLALVLLGGNSPAASSDERLKPLYTIEISGGGLGVMGQSKTVFVLHEPAKSSEPVTGAKYWTVEEVGDTVTFGKAAHTHLWADSRTCLAAENAVKQFGSLPRMDPHKTVKPPPSDTASVTVTRWTYRLGLDGSKGAMWSQFADPDAARLAAWTAINGLKECWVNLLPATRPTSGNFRDTIPN